mgnify:CR=1 FL=1
MKQGALCSKASQTFKRGTEWMPYEGTMYLQPGQHRVDHNPTPDFDEEAQVRWVNPLTHSSQHDVIMGYIGDKEVPTIPDIGSPYSFNRITSLLSI